MAACSLPLDLLAVPQPTQTFLCLKPANGSFFGTRFVLDASRRAQLSTVAALLPHGLWVGPPLNFAAAPGGGHDAAAGLVDGLFNECALAVGEGFTLFDEYQVSHPGRYAFDRTHTLVGFQ